MGKADEEYDWLNDPFDDAKNAQDLQELDKARRRSRVMAVAALVVVLLLALFVVVSCGAIAFLGDGLSI